METRAVYKKLVTKEVLTEEEKALLEKRKEYIKEAVEYLEFLPEAAQEYVDDYKRETLFLDSLRDEEKNETIRKNIMDAKTILDKPSKLQREEMKRDKEQVLIRKREMQRERQAGYMNATIIIFLVANLGLFLATLLLFIK